MENKDDVVHALAKTDDWLEAGLDDSAASELAGGGTATEQGHEDEILCRWCAGQWPWLTVPEAPCLH